MKEVALTKKRAREEKAKLQEELAAQQQVQLCLALLSARSNGPNSLGHQRKLGKEGLEEGLWRFRGTSFGGKAFSSQCLIGRDNPRCPIEIDPGSHNDDVRSCGAVSLRRRFPVLQDIGDKTQIAVAGREASGFGGDSALASRAGTGS